MDQKRAPSSWGRDTTPGLFWRRQNQRRETTRTVHIPSAARLHRISSVQGKLLKLLQKKYGEQTKYPPSLSPLSAGFDPWTATAMEGCTFSFQSVKIFQKTKGQIKKTRPSSKTKKKIIYRSTVTLLSSCLLHISSAAVAFTLTLGNLPSIKRVRLITSWSLISTVPAKTEKIEKYTAGKTKALSGLRKSNWGWRSTCYPFGLYCLFPSVLTRTHCTNVATGLLVYVWVWGRISSLGKRKQSCPNSKASLLRAHARKRKRLRCKYIHR